jgi:tryptophan-rich hypothetical protein
MKPRNRIVNVKKLIKSKWTAVTPSNKEKHFIVVKILIAELATYPVELIQIEAIHSKRIQVLAWQQLKDESIWQQGWV